MARQYYCSICGLELIHSRKAVQRKGLILDLIDPHECEGYAVRSNIDEKPTILDVLDSLKDVSRVIEDAAERTGFSKPNLQDKRSSVRASTAPKGLLKNLQNSEPESELD